MRICLSLYSRLSKAQQKQPEFKTPRQTVCTQATLQLRKEIPNRCFLLGHGAPGDNERSIMTNNTITKGEL
jgi:hypothetical protein